jgi:hypothetical protein
MDNQASAAYKKTVGNSDMTCELVPPNNHQCNMAEKAIQTFKDHFVGILAQWLRPYFPFASLVPTSSTGRKAISSPLTITTTSQLIHLCARLWPSGLQQISICSNQDGGPSTQQTTQMFDLCRTLQKGVCPWHVHQTLLVLEILVNGNPSYWNLGRCIFQAQVPD